VGSDEDDDGIFDAGYEWHRSFGPPRSPVVSDVLLELCPFMPVAVVRRERSVRRADDDPVAE